MFNQNRIGRMDEFVAWGKSGNAGDVDRLMHTLILRDDLATTKLVDYALSLVATPDGTDRVKHYLFNGSQIQRNYAALYFKRMGRLALLDQAVADGKIDVEQAYAK